MQSENAIHCAKQPPFVAVVARGMEQYGNNLILSNKKLGRVRILAFFFLMERKTVHLVILAKSVKCQMLSLRAAIILEKVL